MMIRSDISGMDGKAADAVISAFPAASMASHLLGGLLLLIGP
jgi:hypothetical protein